MLLLMVWKPVIQIRSTSILMWLRIVISVEIIWIGALVLLYIWYIHQRHSHDMEPDIIHSLYSSLQPSNSLGKLRYIGAHKLVEEQAMLLYYQNENLRFLTEEILHLQECLSKYKHSENGDTPKVDMVHRLAAREQEIRALSAELHQHYLELHQAQNVIGEHDSEIQRLHSDKEKFVLENQRLRDKLEEWSMNVAKMERAIKVERHLSIELQKRILKLMLDSKLQLD